MQIRVSKMTRIDFDTHLRTVSARVGSRGDIGMAALVCLTKDNGALRGRTGEEFLLRLVGGVMPANAPP